MKRDDNPHLRAFRDSLHRYRTLLREAWEGVLQEDVSKYPVFIFHRQEVNVGIPIAERKEHGADWSVNVSTLEEFYIKGLVTIEQAEEIKRKLGSTPAFYCCLVIGQETGSLVFIEQS